ncbi:MAG: TPM domain-containing protein [Clostridia bacterium]
MRRYIFCILLSFLFIAALAVPSVFAADRSQDLVLDQAGLLTNAEEAELRDRIAEITGRFQCDIVILTVNSMGGKTARTFADDYLDAKNDAYENAYDGILFLIAMEEREWYIATSGTAISVFTDYGLSHIEDQVTGYLRSGDYGDAFGKFVSLCEDFLREAAAGKPYDTDHKIKAPKTLSDYAFYVVISLAIGAVVAWIVTSSMKSKLKTVVPQRSAQAYLREDGVRLTNSKDLYLYRSLSRTPRPKNTGGSGRGGGSTTHRSAGGRSYGGRGGKF